MMKWFNVGKIVNTHGVKGEVRVISATDFADERYAVGSRLRLEHDQLTDPVTVTISGHRKHKNFDLLTFDGYNNLNDVEIFKGGTLKISEDDLSDLDEGEYYYFEIIGCKVISDEGEELGVIKEILSPGANDVWVIKRKKQGEKDLLIPYIDDVVKEINIDKKQITVHLLDGLV
ncbi:ribosome maturation factor RimM [Anaerobacillus sp. MEB173]|uniref:ribosome maturation factor RimM n=1 Tax=Anaerobacillus sp. MEB173 TaxID=3383345 RepID=UPI003F91D0D1